MLIEDALLEGLRTGTTTRTFRRWRQPRVREGNVYLIRRDLAVRVTKVRPWKRALTQADAQASGFGSLTDLERALGSSSGKTLYRIDIELCNLPVDERARLARNVPADEVIEGIAAKLDAMDRRQKEGPWTLAVLRSIERDPGRRAAELAELLGWPTLIFKTRVRRLKALGLTTSLEIGYRLSPRGAALRAWSARQAPSEPTQKAPPTDRAAVSRSRRRQKGVRIRRA